MSTRFSNPSFVCHIFMFNCIGKLYPIVFPSFIHISKLYPLCWQVKISSCDLSDYVCKLKSTSIFLPRQTVMISQGLVGRINFARFVDAHPAITVIYFETRFKLVIFIVQTLVSMFEWVSSEHLYSATPLVFHKNPIRPNSNRSSANQR